MSDYICHSGKGQTGYYKSKDDYLEHHGINGQKWGKKNGPPYPLESDVSTGKSLKLKKLYKKKAKLEKKEEKYANKLAKQMEKGDLQFYNVEWPNKNGRIMVANKKFDKLSDQVTKNVKEQIKIDRMIEKLENKENFKKYKKAGKEFISNYFKD